MRPFLRRLSRPAVGIPVGVVAVALVACLLYLFAPWALFVNEVVDEARPAATTVARPTGVPTPSLSVGPTDGPTAAPTPSGSANPADAPTVLARGTFISHEHATTGNVIVLGLADGRRVLRIEDLDTSNGPDLQVWLTDAPVLEGVAGWGVFDDGAYVSLGALKGNKGSQNYEVPASADLAKLKSVSIWCRRFSVSFGAAELRPAGG